MAGRCQSALQESSVPVSLFNKEMEKDNTTCSRSPSRQCQSQSGKYPPPVCSGFWLKSNHFCAAGLAAPGQNDTKNSVARTVCVEKQHMALGRCKKEFRSDSSLCFCSELSDARGQETLWLDDMFHFNSAAECRASCWQSGLSWKLWGLPQVFGGPWRKGDVILEIYPVWGGKRLVVTRDTPA